MPFEISFKIGKSDKQKGNYVPTDLSSETISTANSVSNSVGFANALSMFNDPQTALIYAYSNVPELTAPVNFIVDNSAKIPFVHKKKVGKETIIVEDSPYLALLEAPNQFQDEDDFRKEFLLNTILTGENFVNKFIPVGMSFKQWKLYNFQSNLTTVKYTNELDTDWRIKEIEYFTVNGSFIKILPDAMTYRKQNNKLQNPTEKGISVLTSLAKTTKSLQAGAEANIVTKEDRGVMGIISAKDDQAPFQPSDQKKVNEIMYGKYGVTGGKKPIATVKFPVQYTPIALNVKELGITESQLVDLRNICSVLQLSSQMFGDVKASTYNNMKTIKTSAFTDAIVPYTNKTAKFYNSLFGLKKGVEWLEPDYSKVEELQADKKLMNEIYSKMYNDNSLTVDEYREKSDSALEETGRGFKNEIEALNTPKPENDG